MDGSLVLIYFVAIAVVVYGLTAGTKWAIPQVKNVGLGVLLRTLPVLFGLAIAAIPGLFPATVPYGLGVLIGGAAGVFCAYVYHVVEGALDKRKEQIQSVIDKALPPIVTEHNPPKKILCIEDDTTIARSLPRLVEGLGVEVVVIADPKEALTKIETIRVQLVLTDTIGLAVVAQIKSAHPGLPVVAYSGSSAPTTLPDGVSDWVSKGEPPAKLKETVGKYLLEAKKEEGTP